MAKKTRSKRPARGTGRSGKAGKKTPSTRRVGAGRPAAARGRAGTRRKATAKRTTARRTAAARKPRGQTARGTRAARKPAVRTRAAAPAKGRLGGTGRERELAQTPETGRTAQGPTNPRPTQRSTGAPAGAGSTRHAPGLERSRRPLREVEENIPTPPSSLDLDRSASAARTGRQEMREAREEHTESSPVLTGGDVDASWQSAYAVGDEAPGGDNPTPDQDRVDEIGRALGIQYQDNEELRPADKLADRDKHRWELDPASSEDYLDRD